MLTYRLCVYGLALLGAVLIYAGIYAAVRSATAAGCVVCALALVLDVGGAWIAQKS